MKLKILFFISLLVPVFSQSGMTAQPSNQSASSFMQKTQIKSPLFSSIFTSPKTPTNFTIQPESFLSSISKTLLEHKKLVWGAGLLAAAGAVGYLYWRGLFSYLAKNKFGGKNLAQYLEQNQSEKELKNRLEQLKLISPDLQTSSIGDASSFADCLKNAKTEQLQEQLIDKLRMLTPEQRTNVINGNFADCLKYAKTPKLKRQLIKILTGLNQKQQMKTINNQFSMCLAYMQQEPKLQEKLLDILKKQNKNQQTETLLNIFYQCIVSSATIDIQTTLINILDTLNNNQKMGVIGDFIYCLEYAKTPELQEKLITILASLTQKQQKKLIGGRLSEGLSTLARTPDLQRRLVQVLGVLFYPQFQRPGFLQAA